MNLPDPPDLSTPSALEDALRLVGATLTCLAVPASLLWYPVGVVPGAGSVTLADGILTLLWVTVGLQLLLRSYFGIRYDLTLRMVVLSLLLAALAALGALTIEGPSSPAREFCVQMKRFGLAGVLPLALYLFESRLARRALLITTSLCTAAMLVCALYPQLRHTYLAVSGLDPEPSAMGSRMTGLVTNPNDSALVAICLTSIVGCLLFAGDGKRAAAKFVFGLVSVAAIACVVLSASRTGTIALVTAVVFLTTRPGWSLRSRLWTLVFLGASLLIGGSLSQEFQDRTRQAFQERQSSANFVARLQAQQVVLMASPRYPLGVGYGNLAEATREGSTSMVFMEVSGSDSVYCDTLLGAGILGLFGLLALYRDCWRYCALSVTTSPDSVALVQAGLVALAIFGFATVLPISVFAGPAAFTLVGCAIVTDPPATREESPS